MKSVLNWKTVAAWTPRAGAWVLGAQLLVSGAAGEAAPKIAVDKTPLNREARGTSYAPVIKRVTPSVVNIYSTKSVPVQPMFRQFFDDPLFRRFFGDGSPDQPPGRPQTHKEQSLGSGVIISEDGYILTNNHVVEGADKVEVKLSDGKTAYPARVVGTDPQTEVAVLKVDAKEPLPAITLSDSDKLEVGDVALAIGNPFQVGQSVTMGIISAVGRGGFGVAAYEDWIQTDAAINPGNSGGALVDAQGRLVGINTWIVSGGGGANAGIGFAIPINLAKGVMDRLISDGTVRRGYLGVRMQPTDVTPDLAKAFNLPDQSGVLVTSVEPRSPAATAGVKEGDVIVEFNGKKVADNRHLRLIVSETPPQTKATLKIIRAGKERILNVTLVEQPAELAGAGGGNGSGPGQELESNPAALDGLEVGDLNTRTRRQFNVPASVRGVVVTSVESGSSAEDKGLRPGDVILEIDRSPVESADDVLTTVKKSKGDVILLRVWSRSPDGGAGNTRFVTLANAKRKG